ncbi:MAG: hypothetical protein IJK42_14330 [Prevotella sp.]|nr:hypothetical protein [Prevotella sp.]
MYKGQGRRNIAWGLLAVFAAMMALTTFHQHHYVMVDDEECVQCAHHLPHSGHISWQSADTHDCLVCQLSHTPYLTNDSPETATHTSIACQPSFYGQEDIPLAHHQNLSLRAPPLVLLMA